MELNWTTEEQAAIDSLCKSQDLSTQALMRQALRLYQMHQHRLEAGETCHYSGDAARAAEFAKSAKAMSFEQACIEVKQNRLKAPYLSRWKHIKSGGLYTVRLNVIIEANLEPAVIYYPQHGAPEVNWCRPASEFFDGRFELISMEVS